MMYPRFWIDPRGTLHKMDPHDNGDHPDWLAQFGGEYNNEVDKLAKEYLYKGSHADKFDDDEMDEASYHLMDSAYKAGFTSGFYNNDELCFRMLNKPSKQSLRDLVWDTVQTLRMHKPPRLVKVDYTFGRSTRGDTYNYSELIGESMRPTWKSLLEAKLRQMPLLWGTSKTKVWQCSECGAEDTQERSPYKDPSGKVKFLCDACAWHIEHGKWDKWKKVESQAGKWKPLFEAALQQKLGHKGYEGKVFVYYNINLSNKLGTPLWSLKASGKVIGHDRALHLRDVAFQVSDKGRDRVRAEKHKNVHAGVTGYLIDDGATDTTGMTPVTYNPYKYETFVTLPDEQPIHHASEVIMIDKKVWAKV